jgi:hypothetical protein
MQVARYYEARAKAIGLADVKLIPPGGRHAAVEREVRDLWLLGPEPERIASTLQTPAHLADFSRAADVTAELVDVGAAAASDSRART